MTEKWIFKKLGFLAIATFTTLIGVVGFDGGTRAFKISRFEKLTFIDEKL
jgi:hypothetical protein